ncbi:MAG: hypothetical protein PHG63_01050 [Candidatus Dojkabacteria bacterium]|nr:hypothetical protein [Candidatus Dojkabacteria bacterium]
MPKPRGKQPDPYDTLYLFLLGEKRPPKTKFRPTRGLSMPTVGGLADAYAQMIAGPGMFPVTRFMQDIGGEVDNLHPSLQKKTEPLSRMELKVTPNNLAWWITDPRKMIGGAFEDYKGAKKLARTGGGYRLMDSALFGAWGFSLGLPGALSRDLASSMKDYNPGISGEWGQKGTLTGEHRSQASPQKAARSATESLIQGISAQYSGLTPDALRKAVEKSYRAQRTGSTPGQLANADKEARLDTLESELRSLGRSQAEAKDIAKVFWGDPTNDRDFGVWLTGHNNDALHKKNFESKLFLLNQEIAKAGQNTPKGLALTKYRDQLQKYADGKPGLPYSLGYRIGQVQHIRGWAQEIAAKGMFTSVFLWGDVGSMKKVFGVGGLLPDILVPEDEQWGTNGMLMKANSNYRAAPIGKAAEIMHYVHPVNLAKGMLWDGRLWGKLAQIFNNRGHTGVASTLEMMASLTPKQLARTNIQQILDTRLMKNFSDRIKGLFRDASGNWRLKKSFAGFAGKMLGRSADDLLALPIKEILKQMITKVITQVIGNTLLPGVGFVAGLIADVVINVSITVAEKAVKPFFELIAILIFGGIALMLMGVSCTAQPLLRMHRHQNLPIQSVSSQAPADSTLPPGYTSTCIAPSAGLRCNQGPCGSTSHAARGSHAVDLGWTNIAGAPLVAPTDGEIIYAVSSSRCEDGTNKGGIVQFKDSAGYIWTIVHTAPLSGVGSITAGTPIAQVQLPPAVEFGKCWKGAHAHIEIKDPSGKYVDAEQFINNAGCSFTCPADEQC